MPSIDVSTRTYQRLHRHATSFDDRPEDVIVRLLDEVESTDSAAFSEEITVPAGGASRAAPGSILPIQAYWIPILRTLEDFGGAAPANDVVDALEVRMRDIFTKRDLEPHWSGGTRWRNRARFARLRMKERGLLSETSQRGVWEMTQAGRDYLARNEQGG